MDWAGNSARMVSVTGSESVKQVTRRYLMLHAHHEGGNVSEHTTHLVGSALTFPYMANAAGNRGLAAPMHGLANQDISAGCSTQEAFGSTPAVKG